MVKIRRRILSFSMACGLTVISMFANGNTYAKAATGLNMNDSTMKGYAYSNSNFPVYNSMGSNKAKIGTCYGNSDLITVSGVGMDGWSRITYPVGGCHGFSYTISVSRADYAKKSIAITGWKTLIRHHTGIQKDIQ